VPVLDALVRAAEHRGFAVSPGAEGKGNHLSFTLGAFKAGITMKEGRDSVPHVPTAAERRAAERSPWVRIPPSDRVPSGRLRLELDPTVRDGRWYRADRKRSRIEERLGEIVIELEYRATVERARQDEVQRVLDRRRRAWDAGVREAEVAYAEACRVRILDEQLDAWEQTRRLRGWATAVEENMARQRVPGSFVGRCSGQIFGATRSDGSQDVRQLAMGRRGRSLTSTSTSQPRTVAAEAGRPQWPCAPGQTPNPNAPPSGVCATATTP